MLRSAEEMLDGQHQRVNVRAHDVDGLLCRKDWKRISIEWSLVSPDDLIGRGSELKCMMFGEVITH